MSTNVKLHLSAFRDQNNRHGGVKRSQQLRELARTEGHEVLFLPSSPGEAFRTVMRAPFSLLQVLPTALMLTWRFLGLRGAAAALLYGGWIHAELCRHRSTELEIEITSGPLILIGNILVSLRIPFTVYPHNLEFMVPGQRRQPLRSEDAAFAAEMRIYRYAQTVRAISNFDATVLRALGVEAASVLPYCPPAPDVAELEVIREQRGKHEDSFILLLGTAGNPPTRQGLQQLLALISEEDGGRRFVLAGFGTEKLSPLAPPCVEVRGGVRAEELRTLLTECTALLVFQPPTSGMLTRLVEAAIAGIPAYVMGGYLQTTELSDCGVHSIDDLSALPLTD